MWSVSTGEEIRTFTGHTDGVFSVAFSPDGQFALSGDFYGEIRLWETGLNVPPTAVLQPPVAVFTVSPSSGEAPLIVTLDAKDTYNSDGTINAYQWSSSDGQTATSRTATLTLPNAGTYAISLVVTDNDGLTGTQQETITVSEQETVTVPEPVTVPVTSGFAVLEFKGLKDFYQVGEKVVIELIETVNRDKYTRIDLWVAIKLPDNQFLYRTDIPLHEWNVSAQPHKTSVENTETSHYIFDFELPEGMGGDYTLYAAYVQEGENPVTNGLSIRSNLAIRQIVLANRKDL